MISKLNRKELITDIGERLTDVPSTNSTIRLSGTTAKRAAREATHVLPASSMSMAARSTMCKYGPAGRTSVKTRWKLRSPAAKARLAAGSTTTAWNKPCWSI